ncbi:CPG4 domain-containing protein [Trichostrongylus colubriformis]|uniref:CPG4 domain-containing protein n=1 Tax=Trichostrongylus colubriformis TaxID=6319 RepID=A0AAN8EXY2_TRICO
MCGERAPLFEKMRPCLTKYGDAAAQLCDSKCYGRTNVTAFLNNPAIIRASRMAGGNILAVNDHLGGLCSAFNCMLPCATVELNKVCPLSGWLTLDILLQPMEAVADLLLKASPSIKDFVAKKMDKRCRFAIQKSEIMKLRKGQFNYP